MQEFHYVSSVKGHLVTRYPTLRMSVVQYIGATRLGKTVEWNTDEITAISDQEWQKYRREYRRCVANEALVIRTKDDYDAYVSEKTKREAEALKAEATEQQPSETEPLTLAETD